MSSIKLMRKCMLDGLKKAKKDVMKLQMNGHNVMIVYVLMMINAQ